MTGVGCAGGGGGVTPGSSFITTLGTMFLRGGSGGGAGSPGSCFTTTLGVVVAAVVVVVLVLLAVVMVPSEEGMSIVCKLLVLGVEPVLEGKSTMRWLLAPDSSSKG